MCHLYNGRNQQLPNQQKPSDLSSSHQPKTHIELWHVMCFAQQGGDAIHHLSDVGSWDGVDHSLRTRGSPEFHLSSTRDPPGHWHAKVWRASHRSLPDMDQRPKLRISKVFWYGQKWSKLGTFWLERFWHFYRLRSKEAIGINFDAPKANECCPSMLLPMPLPAFLPWSLGLSRSRAMFFSPKATKMENILLPPSTWIHYSWTSFVGVLPNTILARKNGMSSVSLRIVCWKQNQTPDALKEVHRCLSHSLKASGLLHLNDEKHSLWRFLLVFLAEWIIES